MRCLRQGFSEHPQFPVPGAASRRPTKDLKQCFYILSCDFAVTGITAVVGTANLSLLHMMHRPYQSKTSVRLNWSVSVLASVPTKGEGKLHRE